MSQIDLKQATISLRDGGATIQKTGAINNAAGYAQGAVTFAVDGFTGAVETGGTLVIGSEEYVITAHTETTSNTTSITIATPGLASSVADDAVLLAKGKVQSLEINIGTGTCTYTEKRAIEYTLDRGKLSEVRAGDEAPMDVKLDFVWEYIKGTGLVPSVEDAFKKRGAAASWRSSDTDQCRPYAVDIVILYTPECGGGDQEEIVLKDFRYEDLAHDAKAGTVAVTGKCNVLEAVVTRSAQA